MEKSESIIELSKSLAKFQQEVKQPMKDKDNPFFKSKYVPLENVVEAIADCAPKHGLSYLQWPVNYETKIGVVTMLLHSSGEYIEFDPMYMRPEKDTPQGNGSTLTYLRRYALSTVFGITSDQDDDGNAGSGNGAPPKNQPAPNAVKPKTVGVIKTKVMRFAKMRDKNATDVYKALKCKDVEQLTEEQGQKAIETLDKWIKQADKEDAQKEQGA